MNFSFVWCLDRLGPSLKHLIQNGDVKCGELAFVICKKQLIAQLPGNLVVQIFGSLVEFKRNFVSEHTQVGLEAAWISGRREVDRKLWIVKGETLS